MHLKENHFPSANSLQLNSPVEIKIKVHFKEDLAERAEEKLMLVSGMFWVGRWAYKSLSKIKQLNEVIFANQIKNYITINAY